MRNLVMLSHRRTKKAGKSSISVLEKSVVIVGGDLYSNIHASVLECGVTEKLSSVDSSWCGPSEQGSLEA